MYEVWDRCQGIIWQSNCYQLRQKVGSIHVLVSAAIAFLVILGLFLSMLSSSPRTEVKVKSDTEV